MKVAGLFAGIGGFELGLASAGHEAVLLCDIDPLAQKVLKTRFSCEIFSDVREVSVSSGIDLVTSGFPCQDLSQVGTGQGIDGTKSGIVRHLFSILEHQPVPWVLLENVPFMLRLCRGQAIRYLVQKLERLGYDWVYRVIDSHAFGLPQRRRRVFLLASLTADPRPILLSGDCKPRNKREMQLSGKACGFYWTEGNRGLGWAVDAVPPLKGGSNFGIVSAPAIMLPNGDVVLPDIRDGERLQGFSTNWTEPASDHGGRIGDRWRLVGNAVNVRVSAWLGNRLNACDEEYDDSNDEQLDMHQPWPSAAWGVNRRRGISLVSDWPMTRCSLPLVEFLKYSNSPLSYRATTGFKNRLASSRLRVDEKFISCLERHAQNMKQK